MTKVPSYLLAAFLALSIAAWGDTFTLKSGEKVEGSILSETDKVVTLQIAVTATIKDERVLKKTDIVSVEKIAPDEQAWPALKALALGDESLEAADYAQAITKLGAFVSLYPQSSHAAEAKTKLGVFDAEKKRIEAGELKIGGKWLNSEQAEQEKVQIAGDILLSRMKRFAVAIQYVETMNVFDALEKNYPGCAAMPDAIDIARQAIPALRLAAEQRQTQFKQNVVENAARLANARGTEREQVEALQKKNLATLEAAVAAAEHSGANWLPLSPANDRSLTSLINRCNSELTRINALPVEKMRQSIKAIAKARAAFETNDLAAVEKALTDAGGAWSANEQVKRLQAKLVIERQKAAEAAKAEAAEKAAIAKANAEKLAKLKAEAVKAEAEAKKARDEKAARDAETAAAEQEKCDRENRNRIIMYSLGGIAVIILLVVVARKKPRPQVEILPEKPDTENPPAK